MTASGANPSRPGRDGNTVDWSRKANRLATSSRPTQGVTPSVRSGVMVSLFTPFIANVPCQAADLLAHLSIVDPSRPRRLRVQTGPGQPGQVVRFQAEDVPLLGHPEVDAGIPGQFQGAVRPHRQFLQFAGERGVEICGKCLL